MTVVAPVPRPNSLLPRAPAPWRPAAAAALGLPAAVQSLLQQLGGTFHTYHPFRRARRESDDEANIPRDPAPLLLLCRQALISSFGLRKLRRLLLWAGAPRAVSRILSTIGAGECEALGAAPLTDVFAQPFFHRAITWRVTCCLDRQPYLTTYAATNAIHGYCVPWVSPAPARVAGFQISGFLCLIPMETLLGLSRLGPTSLPPCDARGEGGKGNRGREGKTLGGGREGGSTGREGQRRKRRVNGKECERKNVSRAEEKEGEREDGGLGRIEEKEMERAKERIKGMRWRR